MRVHTKAVIAAFSIAAIATGTYAMYADSPDDVATGPIASVVRLSMLPPETIHALNSLPASAAGLPLSGDFIRDAADDLPPLKDASRARGRVTQLHVRVAQGVLVDWRSATAEQRNGWRYVTLDFPEPLDNGAIRAMALVPAGAAEPAVGDIVEMRFANRAGKGMKGVSFFAGIERDTVTQLVARSDTAIARSFEQRILAGTRIDPATGAAPDPRLWASLPFEHAVKVVHGNGRHELAVFSDPNCVACRSFEQSLAQLDDTTIYVFMLPVIRPDLKAQSRHVWCAADRARAWEDLTLRGVEPAAADCADPVEANMGLLRSVDIRATPTIVFPDGQRAQGSLPAATLRQRLASGQAQPAARASVSGASGA